MAKKREIRNSTAEFLIFQTDNKKQGIEVMYADDTIWCTQKAMAALFDVGVPAICGHLANVFETGEPNEEATISKMEACKDYGQRVQNSVFECEVSEAQFVTLKSRIAAIMDMQLDSIRFYFLSSKSHGRVMSLGKVTSYDVNDAIII